MNQPQSALTVGPEVRDSTHKMEQLEHTARVVLAARLQGPVPPLPAAEVEEAAAFRGKV